MPWQVWWNLNKDNHAWAFYYFMKRKGDRLRLKVEKETISIARYVERKR